MRKYIYITILLLPLFSCKKVYDPELSAQPEILVVDGLITNEHKEHKIKLSRSVRFDTLTQITETGATVFIKNNKEEIFYFHEKRPGLYCSDSSGFRSQIGNRYTLFINTRDGKTYSSQEQELLPVVYLEQITNKAHEIPYFLTIDNKLKKFNIRGAEFYANQSISSPEEKYCRFSNVLLVEFTSITEGVLSYCWKKYDANVYPLLSDVRDSNPGEIQHKLGFLPLNVYFYGIYHFSRMVGRPPKEVKTFNYLYHYFVTIKQYHMNENIFDIYTMINKQLKADDKIFDPVNLNIRGNIRCTSNPDEPVFGIFDVSSVSLNTFMIDNYADDNIFNLTPIRPADFDTIPETGFVPNNPPKTWIR